MIVVKTRDIAETRLSLLLNAIRVSCSTFLSSVVRYLCVQLSFSRSKVSLSCTL